MPTHIDNRIFLLIGKSGCGKSTIAKHLEMYGYKQLPSFTTRPLRIGEVSGQDHIFITYDQFIKYRQNGEIACSTLFDFNYYGATYDMIKNYDIYIIDKNGLIELQQNAKGIEIIPIYIQVSNIDLIKRMRNRGDRFKQIIKRLKNDKKMFNGIKEMCKYKIENKGDIGGVVQELLNIIREEDSKYGK